MLPRLQAQERLAGITDGAIAAGNLGRREQRETFDRLEELAGFERKRPQKATPAILASIGVGVTVLGEPSKRAVNDG